MRYYNQTHLLGKKYTFNIKPGIIILAQYQIISHYAWKKNLKKLNFRVLVIGISL